MEISTSPHEERSLFSWAFLGPLSLLLSLSLLLLEAPSAFPLAPVFALVGMTLTWNYAFKGLLSALALLLSGGVYQVFYEGIGDSLWFIGALSSFALSYMITFLTLEEAQDRVCDFKESVLSSLKISTDAEAEKVPFFEKEKEHLLSRIQVLEEEKATLEKVQELARQELTSALTEQEKLTRELSEEIQAKQKLEEDLEAEKVLTQAQENMELKWQREKVKGEEMGHLIDQISREKDLFESTVSRIQEELEAKEKQLHELEDALAQAEAKPQQEPLIDVPPATENEYKRLYGMHKQLREQFELKSQDLDQARKELFHAKEEAAVLALQIKELEAQDLSDLKALSQEVEALSSKYDEALDEIANLEAYISGVIQEFAAK